MLKNPEAKAPKGDRPSELRKRKLAAALAALYAREADQKSRFEQFLKSVADLGWKERAIAWLRFVLEDPDDYGDLEALVYLRSQGEDCSEYISRTIAEWKADEDAAIAACARGTPISTGRKTVYAGSMPPSEAAKIEDRSPYELPDFWRRSNREERVIEATMLRVVDWCAMRGFEAWWRRLAKEATEEFFMGAPEPLWLMWWLAAMVRAEKAFTLMPKLLKHCLEVIRLSGRRTGKAWVMNPARPGKRAADNYEYPTLTHILFTAELAFVLSLMKADSADQELLDEAIGVLEKHQLQDGSWQIWSDNKKGCIESTAYAVQAVALYGAPSAQRVLGRAATWLMAQQQAGGYWAEPACPDPAFLTVLVLDALELADGGTRVTFRGSSTGVPGQQVIEQRRFRVAFSFPGEIRNPVRAVADKLAEGLGRDRVFYDEFYKAELSRPNLDTYLQHIYHNDSDLLVVCTCKEYEKKEWCGLEWRAIRDIIKQRRDADIMPIRFDDTLVPGLFSLDGYLDAQKHSSTEIADLIMERLGSSG